MTKDVFVYVIATKKDGKFSAPVKVGVSSSPWGRLDTLQTACPFEIGIVGSLKFPSREIAMQMEDCFHYMQRADRLRGEWFNTDPDKALGLMRIYARWALELLTSFSEEEREACIREMEAHL